MVSRLTHNSDVDIEVSGGGRLKVNPALVDASLVGPHVIDVEIRHDLAIFALLDTEHGTGSEPSLFVTPTPPILQASEPGIVTENGNCI